MVKLKVFLGLVMGVGLYGLMSYYQPITESYAASQQVETGEIEPGLYSDVISSIPYESVLH